MTNAKENAEQPPCFLKEDEGAVTVDWVVLAAAVVLLAIPVSSLIGSAVETTETDIADRIVDSAAP